MGITSDGSIRSGSALEMLKGKVEMLAGKLQQWQQDGTLDRLAQKLDKGLATAAKTVGKAFQWVQDNGDTVKRWIVGLGSALAAVKVMLFASDVITAVKNVSLFAKTVGALVAAHPIVLAIGAAIAAGALLIANWDKVKSWAANIRDQFAASFGGIKDSIVGAFEAAREKVAGFFSWIDEKIEGIPLLGKAYKGVKNWWSEQTSGINWGFGGHATGTSYFPGGWTRVNERGGEIMRLPGGTQIIPHDVSRQMVSGPRISVQVIVQGNVIGNDAYAQQLGDTIVARILRALRNT